MKIEINNGVVTNDGAELGIIQDGTCHLTQKVAPVIKGKIREVSGNAELKFLVGEAPDNDDGTAGSDGPVGQNGHGPGPQGAPGYLPDAPPPAAPPPAAAVESNPHDPKPERDLIRGDKCPKLIAWKQRQQKGGK